MRVNDMADVFSVEGLVQSIRLAANMDDPEAAIREVLVETVKNPDAILAATSDEDGDETMYFEDDKVSIWRCRFHPKIVMPPHEHCLKVLIGVYSGGEKSILYKRTEEGLSEAGSVTGHAGEVITLGKAAIHAVTTKDDKPSDAFHVYLGPLMQLERDLYDWESGKAVAFTLENFEAMKRSVAQ
jgi:predicted metal-dependent enzyme (double-stranded beta helix superfamily)